MNLFKYNTKSYCSFFLIFFLLVSSYRSRRPYPLEVRSKSRQPRYQLQSSLFGCFLLHFSQTHTHTFCTHCSSLVSHSESWLYCLKIQCHCCSNVVWEDETCLWIVIIIYIDWVFLIFPYLTSNNNFIHTSVYRVCSNESKRVRILSNQSIST